MLEIYHKRGMYFYLFIWQRPRVTVSMRFYLTLTRPASQTGQSCRPWKCSGRRGRCWEPSGVRCRKWRRVGFCLVWRRMKGRFRRYAAWLIESTSCCSQCYEDRVSSCKFRKVWSAIQKSTCGPSAYHSHGIPNESILVLTYMMIYNRRNVSSFIKHYYKKDFK